MSKAVYITVLSILALFAPDRTFAHFGPRGPLGGTVSTAIAHDSLVYLGTVNGGVYISTNSRLVGWTARPVGLKSGRITALAHTGSYLFAATADSGIYIFTGRVGNDRHWTKVNNGLTDLRITSLVALDSITVIAGTEGAGTFKTTNKGATWQPAHTGLPTARINALANAGSRIIASTGAGIYASDNGGGQWIDLNDGQTAGIAAHAVSFNAATNELLTFNENGLFFAGSAHTAISLSFTAAGAGTPPGTVVRSISNNGTDWYLATDKGVYTSLAGTINWSAIGAGLTTDDITTVVPFRTGLVAGTNGSGIFKTEAAAIAWVPNITGYSNLVTHAVLTRGLALVVAATEKGVFVSRAIGLNYVRANDGLGADSVHVTALEMLGTDLYAATRNSGVFHSADTGRTWMAHNAGLANLDVRTLVAANARIYAICSNGTVYQSSGGMGSWANIQNGLPSGVGPTSIAAFGSTLLLGTYGHGVFTRDEAGGSWAATNGGLSNLNVTSVTASSSKVYAGTDGNGVFVADPADWTWATTAPLSVPHTTLMGLDGSKVQQMAYYNGYVYASHRGGLLATANDGAQWIEGGNQFNLPSFTAVRNIQFVTTRVFVSTENNGPYSNSLSELPVIFDLGVQYDNHVNGAAFGTGDVPLAFTITNHGNIPLLAGDTVYVGARINGTLLRLDFSGPGADPIVLSADVPVGGTVGFDPGTRNVGQTLLAFGVPSAEVAMVVYGRGLVSVNPTFSRNYNQGNNATHVVFAVDAGIADVQLPVVRTYPNPVVNEVVFEFSGTDARTLTISDLRGGTIDAVTVRNSVERYDATNLANGMYVYTIRSNDRILGTGKLVVTKE